MCNRTDCYGSAFGEMACSVCREMDMSKAQIESQIGDYASHLGYMTPEDVEQNSHTPHTLEEHALDAAAHSLVSERHDKYDLVNMVYAILKREHAGKDKEAAQ